MGLTANDDDYVDHSDSRKDEKQKCFVGRWRDDSDGSDMDSENASSRKRNRNVFSYSEGRWKDEAEKYSVDSWRDGWSEDSHRGSEIAYSRKRYRNGESLTDRLSRKDTVLDDDLLAKDETRLPYNSDSVSTSSSELGVASKKGRMLSSEDRELHRFLQVKRKKDFIHLGRIEEKVVNILEGLKLHTGIFSADEQRRIVDFINGLQEMGWRGKLRAHTFSAPAKWMRGKGRQTIQFGCCFNYADDKRGNKKGILKRARVDPLPPLFKSIIKEISPMACSSLVLCA